MTCSVWTLLALEFRLLLSPFFHIIAWINRRQQRRPSRSPLGPVRHLRLGEKKIPVSSNVRSVLILSLLQIRRCRFTLQLPCRQDRIDERELMSCLVLESKISMEMIIRGARSLTNGRPVRGTHQLLRTTAWAVFFFSSNSPLVNELNYIVWWLRIFYGPYWYLDQWLVINDTH